MSSSSEKLLKGLDAIESGNFLIGIKLLNAFCKEWEDSSNENLSEYIQAKKNIIIAYIHLNKKSIAIHLCQQLATNKHPQVRNWAKEILISLSSASSVSLPIKSDVKQYKSPSLTNNNFYPTFYLQTLSEFREVCRQNLLGDLRVFEARRKQTLFSFFILNLGFIFLVYFLIKFHPIDIFKPIWHNYDIIYIALGNILIYFSSTWLATITGLIFFSVIHLIICFIVFLAWAIIYNTLFETFIHGFNSKIIEKIYSIINSNGSLNFSSILPIEYKIPFESIIRDSEIFNGLLKANYITQNNLIFGTVNNTNITFAEVDVSSGVTSYWDISEFVYRNLMTITDLFKAVVYLPLFIIMLVIRLFKGIPYVFGRVIKGRNIDYQRFKIEILRNQTYSTHTFRGLFFTAKFNKFSHATTIIRPRILKTQLDSINRGNKQLVKLEDPEFAKYFIVHSDDQVQARYILSTSLMAKLVDFRKKAGRNIYASFIGDVICIAIEYPDGVFEPSLFRSMLFFEPLREYFETIQLMLGIVEDLDLDKRIWISD